MTKNYIMRKNYDNYVVGTYFRTQEYYVSQENYNDEVTKKFNFPDEYKIHDVTLRDGEQQTGVAFTKEEKIEIAKLIAASGVHRIETGMPAVSKGDEEAIREIVKLDLGPEIFAFARATEGDINLAKDCGVDGVVIEIPVNDELIKFGYQWDDKRAMEAIKYASRLAHEKGLFVNLFLMDSSRLNINEYISIVKEIQRDGWADSCTLVDTQGVLSTPATKYMIKKAVSELDIPVETHFHNDLGLAVSNTLAAFEEGASTLHTTMLGIGPRSGQAATEQVVLSLKLLYGIDAGHSLEEGISMSKLYKAAKAVGELAPFNYPINQPIVGKDLFTLEDGMPVTWWQRISEDHPLALYGILPAVTGRPDVSIVLGKNSGAASIDYWLNRLDLKLKDNYTISDILGEVKAKGLEKKDVLDEEEFKEIANKYTVSK